MDFQISFNINKALYLRDPESSDLGKQIIKTSIDLIYELGFEQFTFKKLAQEISSTEASVYRYFENKHRLLLYIINWYWCYLDFLLVFKLENIQNNKQRLKTIIELLTHELPASAGHLDYNKAFLNQIVIIESSKTYLVKEVVTINNSEVFKPYKDLCGNIASHIIAYNPNYKYPRSLSSTLIESSHQQQFFCQNLPRLTDVKPNKEAEYSFHFLSDLLFKVLD